MLKFTQSISLYFLTICIFSAAEVRASCEELLDNSRRPETNTMDDSAFYVEIKQLFPSQIRFSKANVDLKVRKMGKNRKLYDDKSVLALTEALPVVRSQWGYLLIDGHHDVLKSIRVGAKWVPVRVEKDLSHLSRQEFWAYTKEQGWTYLQKINGTTPETPPSSFAEMENDPNRYLAAILARKFPKGSTVLNQSWGAEYPVWIKLGKDTPYIEFHIADALYQENLLYQESWQDNPPMDFVEKVRNVLTHANIKGLKVVSRRIHYNQLPELFAELIP